MKKKEIDKLIDMDILKMSDLNRYNNRTRLTNENIAEHSFYVAFAVMKLCEIFNVKESTKLKALQMSILHDIAEVETNDIPYPTKQKSPELKLLLEQLEMEYVLETYPQFYNIFSEFVVMGNTEASLLVKVADAISVLQYAKKEIALGNNTPDMLDIYVDTTRRVNEGLEKLEQIFIKGENTNE